MGLMDGMLSVGNKRKKGVLLCQVGRKEFDHLTKLMSVFLPQFQAAVADAVDNENFVR